MSENQNLPQADILSTLLNTDETRKVGSPLVIHEQIQNTPFTITGNQETGYFVRLGRLRLTEHYDKISECRKIVEEKQWDFICNLIISLHKSVEQTDKIISKTDTSTNNK